jgi:preprotein translocase subunit SecE
VNRETKRMMQRQGQMAPDGSAMPRKPPPGSSSRSPSGPNRSAGGPARTSRHRTSPAEFTREVREEMRQVAWPTRAELINYSTVVLTTLILMISLIFVLNLSFGWAVRFMFQK